MSRFVDDVESGDVENVEALAATAACNPRSVTFGRRIWLAELRLQKAESGLLHIICTSSAGAATAAHLNAQTRTLGLSDATGGGESSYVELGA